MSVCLSGSVCLSTWFLPVFQFYDGHIFKVWFSPSVCFVTVALFYLLLLFFLFLFLPLCQLCDGHCLLLLPLCQLCDGHCVLLLPLSAVDGHCVLLVFSSLSAV